ncbi:hypothetical protein IMZ11_36015 [Microtetraspora sp. AC03309]|nr:hypothetical protein [Microtetraspora sp. AC03309]
MFADHHLGLVRLALLMVGDVGTAEDVVQEAFARTHAGRRRLRDPGRALAYVRSAVLNGCRSVLRRRSVAFRRAVPYEEIADTMGVAGSTARSTITRGLAALARTLGEES